MIYLEPLGGLGNRMRTIDSMISWCMEYNKEMTVLWNVDRYLNCPFEELFGPVYLNGVEIPILNLPPSNRFYWKKGIIQIPKMRRFISGVKTANKVHNDDLYRIYDSANYLNKVDLVSEVDQMFYSKVESLMNKVGNESANWWIESCYRMSPNQRYYKDFEPVLNLKEKIGKVTSTFKNTVGLHIRRTDHKTAIEFSGLNSFIKIVEKEIENDETTDFFVCSDSHETLNVLKQKFGSKINHNEIGSYDRNNKQAIFDAVVDIYCLAGTRKIYGSYFSSFSQVAANIGGIPEVSVK